MQGTVLGTLGTLSYLILQLFYRGSETANCPPHIP